MMRSISLRKILKYLLVALFWLVVWQVSAMALDKELFLPFPKTVVLRFCELILKKSFWKTVAVSLVRIMLGFSMGVIGASAVALATKYIPPLNALLAPALRAIRATPVASFILLAFLWLESDLIPIFIAFLMVLPIMWENLSAGLSSLDPRLTEMARVFRLSRKTKLFKVILPQIKPHFLSGAFTSLGLAWKSGIAAEVISYPSIAIGKEMNNAKVTLETADVLVWTVVTVAMSLIIEAAFRKAFKRRHRG